MSLPAPISLPPAPLDIRIAFLSTYPPRRCGIGTYTKDLATSINNLNPERLAEIIALDDAISEKLTYPWEVSRRIRQNTWEDYERVLDYLNNSVIDMLSIQHEYGIFGGSDGDYIVRFVRQLEKPYIVTLHTILKNPTDGQRKVIQDMCERARAVIVMLESAADILCDVYGVSAEKIVPIHHGAPDFPFEEDDEAKELLGLQGRLVMSSVNLISEGKGIEYAIEALPEVVKRYPDFLYLIVGQTHPVILEREGEVYREDLTKRVHELGLENHVRFINKYVSLEELITYVRASDFYITPYEGLEQISSGSLAYAIAAGKMCISTSYRYAQEMLAGGRGVLVPPKSPEHITEALLQILADPERADRIRRKCYAQGRKMTWARVGFRHVRLMDHLLMGSRSSQRYPKPRLDYVSFLTDEHGILEHSKRNEKDYVEGYATDDAARGLIVAIHYGDKKLAKQYMAFLLSAIHEHQVYCDKDHDGTWRKLGVGDWFGRTFWAACYALRHGPTASLRTQAGEVIAQLLPSARQITTVRTQSFMLLGLCLLQELEVETWRNERDELLEFYLKPITESYQANQTAQWHWVESRLLYDNAIVPYALLEVARVYNRADAQELGLILLDFILDHTFDVQANHFHFVGNKGWLERGKEKAAYDEQPIEAASTTLACVAAYQVTGMSYYREMAGKAIAWYHGDNVLRRPLYNTSRHSVYDGITASGLNENQGAESILSYLLASLAYAKLKREGALSDRFDPSTSERTAFTTTQS